MIRVGSSAFDSLPVGKKIQLLVARGYHQAAFRSKKNAMAFAAAWKKKGCGKVDAMSSNGPTVDGRRHVRYKNCWYVIAQTRKHTKKA